MLTEKHWKVYAFPLILKYFKTRKYIFLLILYTYRRTLKSAHISMNFKIFQSTKYILQDSYKNN